MVVIALPACTSLDKLRDDARGVSFHPCPGQIVAQTRLAAVDIAPDSPIAQQIWDTHPTPDAYWIAQVSQCPRAKQGCEDCTDMERAQYLDSLTSCDRKVRVECWPKPPHGCARPGLPALMPPPGPPQLPVPPQLPPLPVMPPPRMIKYVRSFDATLDDDLLPLP